MKSFSRIQHWIFDLDNTIYPYDAGIQQQADARMPNYIMQQFGLDYDAARRMQKDFYLKYGTTLSGLIQQHGVDPYHYWDFIFDIDYAALKHDLAFREILSSLPGKKWVYTNSPRSHAEKVLVTLGIGEYFSGIFDLADADFVSKPSHKNYDAFIARHSIEPQKSLFIDDVVRNLEYPHKLGMTTVYLRHDGQSADEKSGNPPDFLSYVDYQTSDMIGFLESVLGALNGSNASRKNHQSGF